MSKECSCVYYDNGKCKKFSDNEVTSWCIEGPCKDKTPSNADRIRAMSDGELAEFICGIYDEENGGVYQDECGKFINGTVILDYDQYKIAEWLKQPAETPTTNADRCVCCGAIIPDGKMVCPNCLVTVKDGAKNG